MCLILVFSFLGFEPQRSQIKFELLLEFYSGLPSSLNSHLWRDWYAVEESLALARIWRSKPRPAAAFVCVRLVPVSAHRFVPRLSDARALIRCRRDAQWSLREPGSVGTKLSHVSLRPAHGRNLASLGTGFKRCAGYQSR